MIPWWILPLIVTAACASGYFFARWQLQKVIAKNKETIHKLQQNQQELEAIHGTALVGIVMFDEDGHYVRVNQTYCDMYGFDSPEELMGKTFLSILPEASHEIAMKLHKDYIAGSPTVVNEWQVRRRDGSPMWVNVEHSRLVHDDGQRFRIGVFTNITRQKLAEEERDGLIDELSSYAHKVAHDLKNPLSIIMGFSDVMLDPEHAPTIEACRDSFKHIYTYGSKMEAIIEGMLLLATIKRSDVEVVPLDMPKLVRDALDRLSLVVQESGAEIICRNEWPVAVGHPLWVEQVWVNYISNAIKYGGSPPIIELSADPVQNGMIRFCVWDNGKGLTEEERHLLFQQFERLEPDRAAGHGLGLSVVKSIVEKLGGQVGVESEIGKGSTFSFTLPTAVN